MRETWCRVLYLVSFVWRSTKRVVTHRVTEPNRSFRCDCDGSPQFLPLRIEHCLWWGLLTSSLLVTKTKSKSWVRPETTPWAFERKYGRHLLLPPTQPQPQPPPPPPAPSKNKNVHRFHSSCEELLRGNRSVVDRVITRVGLDALYGIHHGTCTQSTHLSGTCGSKLLGFHFGGKMAVRSFHFCRPCLTSWFVAKDRDLTRIDAQDTVVAGLQAALIVTAFERLLERSRVSEWPCFRLSNCPWQSYEVSFPRSVQQ